MNPDTELGSETKAAAQVSFGLGMLSALISEILNLWPTFESEATPLKLPEERQPKLLDLATSLTSARAVEPVRAAIAAGDSRAIAGLATIDKCLRDSCPALLAACAPPRDKGAWRNLKQAAGLALSVADACGMAPEAAQACQLVAEACYGLGERSAAIEAYRSALQAAGPHGDATFRSSVLESLADALSNALRFDEAWDCYKQAADEADPVSRRRIVLKQANTHIELGDNQAAAEALRAEIARIKVTGLRGVDLAVYLDQAAQALIGTGEFARAIEMLKEAELEFPAGSLEDRRINAMIQANIFCDAGDFRAAAAAFERAHDLCRTLTEGDIDLQHYRAGLAAALTSSVPLNDETVQYWHAGVLAKERNDLGGAIKNWQLAANRAYRMNDAHLRLRVAANVAALHFDVGMIDDAITEAGRTAGEARERGLAGPESMALGTLGALAASGADTGLSIDPLRALMRGAALLEKHAQLMAELSPNPVSSLFEVQNIGQTANELALIARKYRCNHLVVQYLRSAIEQARSVRSPLLLINRLSGLREVLAEQGDTAGGREAAAEILSLIRAGQLPPRGLIAGLGALAAEEAVSDRGAAIGHLRDACRVIEDYRRSLSPGQPRADFDRDFRNLPYRLAELLVEDDQVAAAFDALQLAKGRQLIDFRASQELSPEASRAAPLTAAELQNLLARAGGRTAVVDLAVADNHVTAFVVDLTGVRKAQVPGDLSAFTRLAQGDVRDREAKLVSLCLDSPLLADLAATVTAAVPADNSLLIVPDRMLYNLPYHAIPLNGQPWGERLAISYAPTAAVLRFERLLPVEAQALVAGDSNGDLPGAAEECAIVAESLHSVPLTRQACTRAALEKALRDDHPDIVHLALHGRGDARLGGRSSILLADGCGGVEWLEFQALTELPWGARLVVFSGCSTGVLGVRHGTELLSVANAALEAGANSVIASLWPVNDDFARSFMESFYEQLAHARGSGPVDLRFIIENARRGLREKIKGLARSVRRDGRHLEPNSPLAPRDDYPPRVEEALAWAPFCLFGSPIFVT
jgi:CHAT domain-containing protein/tetratricopeptide (TPR) repeat protein